MQGQPKWNRDERENLYAAFIRCDTVGGMASVDTGKSNSTESAELRRFRVRERKYDRIDLQDSFRSKPFLALFFLLFCLPLLVHPRLSFSFVRSCIRGVHKQINMGLISRF